VNKTERMSRESLAIEKLKAMVEAHGGPAAFARTWSRNTDHSPIDASYVSQILNGHSPFGEKARLKMAIRCNLDPQYFEQETQPHAQEARPPVADQSLAEYVVTDSLTVLEILRIIRQLPGRAHLEILGAVRVIAAAYGVRRTATTTTNSDDTADTNTQVPAGS